MTLMTRWRPESISPRRWRRGGPAAQARPVGRVRSERGATLVEAAFVFPVLVTLILGIVDFGFAFNDTISLRQGTREGARQAAVLTTPGPVGGGTWNSSNCTTNPTSLAAMSPPDAYDLICYTKQRIGLDENSVRVSIWWDPTTGYTANFSDTTKAYSVVVCSQTQLNSRTGLFSGILNSKVINAKTEIRIEQSSASMTTLTPPVQETALSTWPAGCTQG